MKANQNIRILTQKHFGMLWVIFFLLSFAIRYVSLRQTDFGNGWDAYYYLVQLKAIINEGSMHSSDVSPIYGLLWIIQKITDNYVLSYKICAASLAGFYSSIIFLFFQNVTQQKRLAIIVALFTLFSPTLTFFTSQFPKNLLGISMVILFLHFRIRKKHLFSLIAFVLAFISHRMAAGIILILVFFELFFSGKRGILILLALGAAFTSVLLTGTIHFSDFQRLTTDLTHTPIFSPAAFIRTIGTEKVSTLWLIEQIILLLLPVLTIILLLVRKNHYKPWIISILLLSFILLFPFFKFDLSGISYRFLLGYYLLSPLLMLGFTNQRIKDTTILILSLILVAGAFFTGKTYRPMLHDPPYDFYHEITNRVIEKSDCDSIDLYIMHKGLAEYFTYQSGIDALPWAPDTDMNTDRICRLTVGFREKDFAYYLGDSVMDEITAIVPGYKLIEERTWNLFYIKIYEASDSALIKQAETWENPVLRRPNYLNRKKP